MSSAPEELIGVVGPFFARFLADDVSASSLSVKESLVEQVVASWTQEADLVRAHESEVVINLTEGEGALTCMRETSAVQKEPVELEFRVTDLSGAFHIKRQVKRTTVLTDQGVILGESGRQLSMGPGVVIVARELVVEAETLRVETDRGTSHGAVLAGESIIANTLVKVDAGAKDLSVISNNPPARLRPYMRRLTVDTFTVPFQRYLDLRTILTAFKPSVKGGLSVLVVKLEGKIVKSNEHRRLILERLEELGAVSRGGSWYYLDLPTLGQSGFSLQDLSSGEPTDAVLRFLHGCAARAGDAPQETE